jgi:hypothetical protein
VIHINNANPTADFPGRSIDPHNPTRPRPLIQRDASSKADEVEHVRRLPASLLVRFLEIDPGSAQRKCELGVVVGGGRYAGVGVAMMLSTFSASVIWSLNV